MATNLTSHPFSRPRPGLLTEGAPARASSRRRSSGVWGGRTGRRLRKLLAVLAAAGAVALLVRALTAPEDPGVPVVAADRDLATGTVLTASDLRLVRLPAASVPEGATAEVDELVGHRLAGPASAREVLTGADVHTAALLDGLPEASVAAWLPLGDPLLAGSLRAGDVVDVHSPVDGRRLVTEALVLSVAADESGQGLMLGVAPEEVERLAAAAGADPAGAALGVSVRRP